MLEYVSQVLSGEFVIVATCGNGRCVLETVARLDPDLLVLDISMPVMNGIETARMLKKLACRSKIVFLTVHADRDYVEAAFSAGAHGYVLKPRLTVDLVQAVRGALQGHTFVSPPVGSGLAGKH
jgi:DNA-binding NarL/FixJ family response regulator